jgi:hypothetical protein
MNTKIETNMTIKITMSMPLNPNAKPFFPKEMRKVKVEEAGKDCKDHKDIFCTMTPINLLRKLHPETKEKDIMTLKARNDYLRERLESDVFTKQSTWDDSRQNDAVVGDYFAHVNATEDRVEVFKILDVLPSTTRRNEWDIVEHRTRRVLVLSPIIRTMTWRELKMMRIKLNGHVYKPNAVLQGTTRVKLSAAI